MIRKLDRKLLPVAANSGELIPLFFLSHALDGAEIEIEINIQLVVRLMGGIRNTGIHDLGLVRIGCKVS